MYTYTDHIHATEATEDVVGSWCVVQGLVNTREYNGQLAFVERYPAHRRPVYIEMHFAIVGNVEHIWRCYARC